MPKVIHHNRRRALSSSDAGESYNVHCASSVSMTGAGPRKVSFEEGQYSLGSFSSSQDSFVIQSDPKCDVSSPYLQDSKESSDVNQKLGLHRSQLRRPTPSVCLASLAGGVDSAECSGSSSQNQCPVSPISPSYASGQSGGETQTSPWGYFVDILIPAAHEQAAGEASAAAVHRDYESSQPSNSFATRFRDSILHVPYSRSRRPFSSAIEPYPRAALRRRSGKTSTFLPGLILETSTNRALPSEIKETSKDIVQALTRLRV